MASDVGKALRAKLLADSSIASLVGQRIYPDVLKQSATLPAIVYFKLSTQREHTVSDVTKLAHSRIQFDCVGTSRESANDIAHAVRQSAIAAYLGTTESIRFVGVEIDSGETYYQEAPTDGSQVHRYITSFDLMVHYWEA